MFILVSFYNFAIILFAEQHASYIEEWTKSDKTFYPTRAAAAVLEAVNDDTKNVIVVIGSSGMGKSSIIHNVALNCRSLDGYDVIPFVNGPCDIIQYYDQNQKQVFVIDDICSKGILNKQAVKDWFDNMEK